jgi:hypothetical protein
MGARISSLVQRRGEGNMKKAIVGVVSTLLLTGTVLFAQRPAQNIDAGRHPNLAAAQRLCNDAYYKVVAAQQSNEFDLGGHAQKAKDLLTQAGEELKLAALASNANGH